MNKRSFILMAALCAAATASLAQGASDQPIRIIVPLGPGTPSDSATRIVATGMSEILKRTVIVDNKPGANGVLAVQELMHAKPDGSTLMLGGVSPMAINVAMIKNLPYDPRRDFTPIGGIYNAFQAYLVNPAVPVKTLPEFIAYAKKSPGKVTAGYYSALTQIQFAAMKSLADINILMIPYKTTSNAYTDLGGGIIDATIADMAMARTLVKAGKAKALAISLNERSSLDPNLPAASETIPGFAFPAWSGLVGPAGMPKDVVAKLNAALNTVLHQKESVAKLMEGAAQPWPTTPEEFAVHIDKEVARWTKLARDAGIQPE
jgi:tripartite-type tricarboxylate transporter receptor subunit TctC